MGFDIAYDGDSEVLLAVFLEGLMDQIGIHPATASVTGEPAGWYVALTVRDDAGDPTVELEGLAVGFESTDGAPEYLVVHPTDPATGELLPVEERRFTPSEIASIRIF